MINVTITGTITDVFPVEHIGNFKKRIFWIAETVEASTPQVYQVECWNADVDMPAKEKTGQPLKFHIEIRGKKWEKNGKAGIFNTLRCVMISSAGIEKATTYSDDYNDDPPF